MDGAGALETHQLAFMTHSEAGKNIAVTTK
jgi:hypothetical protein